MPFDSELTDARRVDLTAKVVNPTTGETHVITLCLEIALPEPDPEAREQRIRDWTRRWCRALV